MDTIHAADTLIDFDNNTLYVKHARIVQLLSILQSKSSSPQWSCQHRQSIESVMTLLIHPAASSGGDRGQGRNIFRPWHSIWGTRSARRASRASKPMMGSEFQNMHWTSFVTFDFIWTGISFVNPKYSLNLENIVWGFILSSIFYTNLL